MGSIDTLVQTYARVMPNREGAAAPARGDRLRGRREYARQYVGG